MTTQSQNTINLNNKTLRNIYEVLFSMNSKLFYSAYENLNLSEEADAKEFFETLLNGNYVNSSSLAIEKINSFIQKYNKFVTSRIEYTLYDFHKISNEVLEYEHLAVHLLSLNIEEEVINNIISYMIENDLLFNPFFLFVLIFRNSNFFTENEKEVIRLYFGYSSKDVLTLDEIGKKLGNITRERVRQIANKSEEKIVNLFSFYQSYKKEYIFDIFYNDFIISIDCLSSEILLSENSYEIKEINPKFLTILISSFYNTHDIKVKTDTDKWIMVNLDKIYEKNLKSLIKQLLNINNLRRRNDKSFIINELEIEYALPSNSMVVEKIAQAIFEGCIISEDKIVIKPNFMKTIDEYTYNALLKLNKPSKVEEIMSLIKSNNPHLIYLEEQSVRSALMRLSRVSKLVEAHFDEVDSFDELKNKYELIDKNKSLILKINVAKKVFDNFEENGKVFSFGKFGYFSFDSFGYKGGYLRDMVYNFLSAKDSKKASLAEVKDFLKKNLIESSEKSIISNIKQDKDERIKYSDKTFFINKTKPM